MEIRNQAHPTERQLAALALGKLASDSRARLQRHVDDCPACARFLAETPRDALVGLLRSATRAPSISDQSTPGVRDATTFSGVPNAPAASRSGAGADFDEPAEHSVPEALCAQSKYRIQRLLGRGGMGSVYQAYHERMDRRVAIKIISPALVDNPDALRRFDQEVKAAARLDHPNVARAYDADEFGSLRVLVMEFVPGQSLEKFLASRGRLSVVDACRLVRQAMVGLEHAHQRGMVHRDLKPQNLMLTPDGKVKILDFGLAKVASERHGGQNLTRDNALMGTPHYLAPEQALDAAKADIRADIYSLGCTLYCLLAGSPPFEGDTEMKVLLAHQNDRAATALRSVSRRPARVVGAGRSHAGQEPGRSAANAPGSGRRAAAICQGRIHVASQAGYRILRVSGRRGREGDRTGAVADAKSSGRKGAKQLLVLDRRDHGRAAAVWIRGLGARRVHHSHARGNNRHGKHARRRRSAGRWPQPSRSSLTGEEVTIEAVCHGRTQPENHSRRARRFGFDDVTIEVGGQQVPVKYAAHVLPVHSDRRRIAMRTPERSRRMEARPVVIGVGGKPRFGGEGRRSDRSQLAVETKCDAVGDRRRKGLSGFRYLVATLRSGQLSTVALGVE